MTRNSESKDYYNLIFIMLKFFLLILSLFIIGLWGIFVTRKNFIIILMSIEMMLLAINLNDLLGQVFALFVLTVAAAESAIGLAILVVYYRLRGIISIDFISSIKG